MKLAFLFLIYDTIHHEELWYNFFKNIDHCKYSIYVHYKTNVALKYFEKYKLKNCIPTEYCKPSIVAAQTLLIKEALNDPLNYKFITVSQSCIPLKSFDYIYSDLTKDDMGYFNTAMDMEQYRFDSLLENFDKSIIKKSANWFILNRELAKDMSDNIYILPKFEKVFCPEEHYFIMVVYLMNKTNQIHQNFDAKGPEDLTTFANWIYNDYVFRDLYNRRDLVQFRRGIKNYTSILKKELDYLLGSKCYFGRKFVWTCMVLCQSPRYVNLVDYMKGKIY